MFLIQMVRSFGLSVLLCMPVVSVVVCTGSFRVAFHNLDFEVSRLIFDDHKNVDRVSTNFNRCHKLLWWGNGRRWRRCK